MKRFFLSWYRPMPYLSEYDHVKFHLLTLNITCVINKRVRVLLQKSMSGRLWFSPIVRDGNYSVADLIPVTDSNFAAGPENAKIFPLKMSIFQLMAKNLIFQIFLGSNAHFIKAYTLFGNRFRL